MFNFIFPKVEYKKNGVRSLYLFFENGDFVEVKGSEIVNLNINTYDKLIRSHNGYNPVAESGCIKLKICNKHSFINTSHFLYNETEFKKNRKDYIENRCVSESRITEIWLFDSNNCHKTLHCEIQSKMDGEFLILNILQQPQMGSYQNSNHFINLGEVKKDDIHNIDLDFENCESFVVYNDEIKDINLVFDKKLEWGGGSLNRKIVGGYIRIKLDKDFSARQNHLFDNDKKLKITDYQKRLCGKKGEDFHDICHLYIDYYHAGYGEGQTIECIEVDEIKEGFSKKEENWTYFIGGYCKKYKDDCIIIAFGPNAKNAIKEMEQ